MIELMLQAERLLLVGMIDQAERLYRAASESDPRNAIAVVGLARVALERNDDRAAYDLSTRALEIDPQDAAALRLEARLSEVLSHRGEIVVRPSLVLTQGADGPEPESPRRDVDVPGAPVAAGLRPDAEARAAKFDAADRAFRAARTEPRSQGWEPARMGDSRAGETSPVTPAPAPHPDHRTADPGMGDLAPGGRVAGGVPSSAVVDRPLSRQAAGATTSGPPTCGVRTSGPRTSEPRPPGHDDADAASLGAAGPVRRRLKALVRGLLGGHR